MAGQKFLAPPYYSQRVVFASPVSACFIFKCSVVGTSASLMCWLLVNWNNTACNVDVNSVPVQLHYEYVDSCLT